MPQLVIRRPDGPPSAISRNAHILQELCLPLETLDALDFTPDEAVSQAKHQIDPHDAQAKQVPYEIYNPSLASIIDTFKGGKPWPVERHRKPGGGQRA